MNHLVCTLPRPSDGQLTIADCYTLVKAAHDYLAGQGTRAITTANEHTDISTWGSAIKREGVDLDTPDKPDTVQALNKKHNLVEVINQCATMERLLDALAWAKEQDEFAESYVFRCHPTTSSTNDALNLDNDLILANADGVIIARFEVSDVVGDKDSNRKERKDLSSLGITDPIVIKDDPCRLFMVVSAQFAALLRPRTGDKSRSKLGYYYDVQHSSITNHQASKTVVLEVKFRSNAASTIVM